MNMMNDQRKKHPNAIRSSVLMSFIVLVFLTTIILFAIIIMDVNAYYKDITNYVFNVQSSSVLEIKDSLEQELDESLQDISEKMELEIMKLDLSKLENQLNNGVIPEELSNIFDQYYGDLYLTGIKSDDNDIFICNSDGIIYDSNLQYATEEELERNWEYEINGQFNKEMASETISNLLNKANDSFLVFERKCDHSSSHKMYDSLNEETIREIISIEGLKGLKDYTFLIPLYINENGDIFGKDDVIAGHVQKNNKFIVVQEYNLYDYIMLNHSLDNYMDITVIERDYIRLDTLLKVFAISDIVAILCTILFSASLSNNLYDVNEEKAQLEEKEENMNDSN